MLVKFRFWLSFKLLQLGVDACPDEGCKYWLTYGLKVAGEGIQKEITEDVR